ncbi:phage protein Gp36 family protein [Pelosinus sp. IPA-1]|uniref:phage protein Gp36 family protein n=1 Tax=Pelosinus sp. IPA-1 TaxID=3029569 RepID=UPI0024362A7C|nr:phage protein Gp36 family protein [Pelosinus sp. IPA-1]GMB00920.1 hypothetical protein PIPA1_37190 [Pelosinus sp. IPA-1]
MPYTTEELVKGKSKLENEFDFNAEQHIKDAQAKIDIKLRRKYKVPFADPVPSIIESIATNFAAGFAIEKDYSDRPEKNEPYLAEVLIKRAEADLQDILDNSLLDGMEGVEYAPPSPVEPSELARPAVMSTTPYQSEMDRVLSRWP